MINMMKHRPEAQQNEVSLFLGSGYSQDPRRQHTKSLVFLQKYGEFVAIKKDGSARRLTKREMEPIL